METLKLESLKPAKGSKKKKMRKGRGVASGKGRSCGRGRGGSGHRAGISGKSAFEGGQMPLARRLPKRGFTNQKFKTQYEIVNLSQIQEKFKSGDTVNPEKLKEVGLIKGKYAVKILGNGDIKKKIKMTECAMSATARTKIEEAGGTIDA
jgi:large subunit ribosomal protein L15